MAQPVITAVTNTGCAEQAFLQITARVLTDPPPELEDWITVAMARADAELLPRLRRALPGVSEDEVRFRRESAIGILNFLVTGAMRVDLRGKSATDLERLLVPVIAGALAGGALPRRKGLRRRQPVGRER
jgi:hypothetical protein